MIKGEDVEREALDRCCERQVTGTKLRLHIVMLNISEKQQKVGLQDGSGHMSPEAGGHNYLVDLELTILT